MLWQKNVNFTQYAAVAAELLHYSRDAIEALTLFRDLALYPKDQTRSYKDSWLRFDAHPGDCACQIRSAGLHLVVRAFQAHKEAAEAKIQHHLMGLREVEAAAQRTFHQLCTQNLATSKIGSGLHQKSMPLKDFCYAIGAGPWFDLILKENASHSSHLDFFSRPLDFSKSMHERSAGGLEESNAVDNDYLNQADKVLDGSVEMLEARNVRKNSTTTDSIESTTEEGYSANTTTPLSTPLTPSVASSFSHLPERVRHPESVTPQPRVMFQTDDWTFMMQWIVVCFPLGRYRQVLPSKDGRSLVHRISVQVSPLSRTW